MSLEDFWCSWSVFGVLLRVRESSFGALGASLGALGWVLGTLLGPLGGLLEGSWELFGSSWGRPRLRNPLFSKNKGFASTVARFSKNLSEQGTGSACG